MLNFFEFLVVLWLMLTISAFGISVMVDVIEDFRWRVSIHLLSLIYLKRWFNNEFKAIVVL